MSAAIGFGIGDHAMGADFGKSRAILATGMVAENPTRVELSWPLRSDLISYTVTRTDPNGSSTVLASLAGDATEYLDSSILSGVAYEYQISAQLIGSTSLASCFVTAGLDLPVIEDRGTVMLVIDQAVAAGLSSELDRLERDLLGDGWRVERHLIDVDSTDPPDLRDHIITRHQACDNLNSIFLLGDIPVPYSGNHAPDSHSTHYGAWPADVYYADVDGLWTDFTVNTVSAARTANHNVPGDGKFDQTSLPSAAELCVGRVDLSAMPIYAPLGEIDLLRRYLDKNHAFRNGTSAAADRVLIDDHLRHFSEGFAAPPRAALGALLGVEKISDGNWNTDAAAQKQLFGIGIGFANYNLISGVTSSSNTVTIDPKVNFSLLFGSYFGDWDNINNVMRAQLGTTDGGLAAMYSGRPIWQLHALANGCTLGEVARLTQNAQNRSPYPTGSFSNRTHVALMGDPTLRLFPLRSPAGAEAVTQPGGEAIVRWSAPKEIPEGFLGYHVYRRADQESLPQRLTTTPIGQCWFTDPSPSPDPTYLVKTVVLQLAGACRFQNTSQATFAESQQGLSFEDWSDDHFPSAAADPEADPDTDGLPNLLEFALGLDPTKQDRALQVEKNSSGEMVAEYPFDFLATGVQLELQSSEDLVSWEIVPQGGDGSGGLGKRRVVLDQPSGFVRLKATATN